MATDAATANGTDGVAAITDALEATTIQELGRKVFVGNLSFATKDEQLRDVFQTHGQISDVQIIYRGTRSLGYGFVTFATCEEAEKAVAATDKTEIDGRAINVEIAKPAPGTPGGAVPRAAARAAKASKARQTNGDAKTSDEDHDTDHPSPTGSKARRSRSGAGRGRSKRSRARRPAGESKPEANGDDHGAVTDASTHNGEDQPGKPRSTRTRTRRGKGAGAPGSVDGAKRERRPKKKGPPEGEPSQTLLFVANLPFDVTDEKLKEFFSSYQVASAHVVCRRYGSSVGKSKGFGFVEFVNEENQLKALEEIQGKELDGRALHVKIAVAEAKKEGEEATNGAPIPAPVNSAAA
ncbi:hypothetical protein PGT21_010642 [Puccinia graminis f. sp. tritici]|uniref:RRM domain-containing protein n=2 Tax=Puccinia graminis f. sp. tritici TaxID=56615 RepID=E3KS89_PUCGT|nr:uncharacterized protein PGTG_13383 [Puccinia graminis f. sp. tritici CRL 75-36-700-3]EFP87164.1 hypothetical protein PGTG_13383 [Puccinia graminis f. sp. tritici CRL 75-36-700-3]KAA1073371.1 hypothetical protein PGT21_010176 [Puccinia graminis f. sp. tritici]KAA1076537.1 hypothetical protein PGT21_010642 [Puccinia graminis f. sp. tritici]KAA1111251.1 hypothetical protein PGTUg99_001371 [Puccinia graminis f. sp. tritici]